MIALAPITSPRILAVLGAMLIAVLGSPQSSVSAGDRPAWSSPRDTFDGPATLRHRDATHRFDVHSPNRRTVHYVHRLSNDSERPLQQVVIVVALPETSERQKLHELRFRPEPSEVRVDAWGRRKAYFRRATLAPKETFEVRCSASLTLAGIHWLISERDIGEIEEIPDRILRDYLADSPDLQLSDPILQRAAARVSVEDGDLLEQVRSIHDFVMDSLEYERDDRWDSAADVLRRGKGSCSEYTFLMIALCRLHGIPARYAGGTWIDPDALPRDGRQQGHVDRVFHRWVEVYLPRIGWYPIDPTRDDRASEEGEPYRYFGRLPWSYVTMYHGGGIRLQAAGLGSDYRSQATWYGKPSGEEPSGVVSERFAVWARPTVTLARR